jgi:hypothetical protein
MAGKCPAFYQPVHGLEIQLQVLQHRFRRQERIFVDE